MFPSHDLGEGEKFSFVNKMIPDISFLNSESSADKSTTFTLKAERFPGTGYTQSYASTVTDSTTENNVRIRGRSVGIRVESSNAGMTWRLGSPRINVRQDGKR